MTNNEKADPQKTSTKPTSDSKTTKTFPKTGDKKKPSPNWSLRFLLLVIIFLSGSAVAIYFMPFIKNRLPIVATWIDNGDNGALASITQKLTAQQNSILALENKSTKFESRLSQLNIPAPVIDINSLTARLSTLEESLSITPDRIEQVIDTSQSGRIDMLLSRMSQLEASFIPLSKNMIDAAAAEKEIQALSNENTTQAKSLTNIETRLIALEAQAAKDNTGILLNIKIAELKRKITAGRTYQDELSTVRNIINNGTLKTNEAINATLDYLELNAPNGISTPDQLKNKFQSLIPQMLTAQDFNEASSWWENTLNSLKNMVTIRNTQGSNTDNMTLDAFIADLESWLNGADFQAVLGVVNQLPTVVQMLLETWKAEVEIWMQSEEALNELESLSSEAYLTEVST